MPDISPPVSPTPLTLADAWESYRRVIPADAPPVQVTETRRAFYAGAQSFMSACAATDEGSEERGIKTMCDELAQFVDDLKAGQA